MKTSLPLNRKERFYTGTVFPMIVCANGFRDLGVLARLIPGCELPAIDPDPETTNVQFFTEYSLVESIFGPRTKARFPHPPKTKDTPDIIILIRGPQIVLVAIEAKMYHQPPLHALVKQLEAQQTQLAYLARHVKIDRLHHAALLPDGYAASIGTAVVVSGHKEVPIVTWETLLKEYRATRGGDDYFMGVLAIALEQWQDLCSQPAAWGINAEAQQQGQDIVAGYGKSHAWKTMGRSGGIDGLALTADLRSGNWRAHFYEVSSETEPINGNWFTIANFIRLVETPPEGASQPDRGLAERAAKPKKLTMMGEAIVGGAGDPSVRIVGRKGGLHGTAFRSDLRTGRWRTWSYEVSPEAEPLNANWFPVEDFILKTAEAESGNDTSQNPGND